MYKLAQCFEDGWGCVRDLAKAVDLYTEAAEGEFATPQFLCLAPTHHADGVPIKTSVNPSCEFQLADVSWLMSAGRCELKLFSVLGKCTGCS